MTISDYRDIATISGVILALVTYWTNLYFQSRSKRIDNLKRFFDAHDKLFHQDGFILANINALDNGTYKRDENDRDMEAKFNRFLGDVEKIAYLTSNGAIPLEVQVYLFGYWAKQIQPHINQCERKAIFWELAVHYLDELKKATDDYEKLPNDSRERRLRKHKIMYKKFS